jgi:hypothetical protein
MSQKIKVAFLRIKLTAHVVTQTYGHEVFLQDLQTKAFKT